MDSCLKLICCRPIHKCIPTEKWQ